jgi:hypothetical protein
VIIVSPQASADEAAAILAAVQAVLDSERVVATDPRPQAYRSGWRRAGLFEGRDDGITDVWRTRVF